MSIKEIDGSKASDNIKELTKFDNSMLYNLTIYGQDIIMLLDNKIVKYNMQNGSTDTVKGFDTTQINYSMLSSKYYAVIEDEFNKNNTENSSLNHKYMVQTKYYDSRTIASTQIDDLPKSVESGEYLVYLIYQDKIKIVNKWGLEIKEVPIKFPPKKLIQFNNEKCIALIYSNKIYIVNI
ncbi:hypothetical protein D3C73_1128700 [compost metagenome]